MHVPLPGGASLCKTTRSRNAVWLDPRHDSQGAKLSYDYSMLPTIQNAAELRAVLGDGVLLGQAAQVISARHRLPFHGLHMPTSSFPVLVHDRYVVKLIPHRFRAKFEAERTMLALVHGKLPVATPEIVAVGELGDWDYLVMTRIAGRAASAALKTVSDAEQRPVLRAIGELIACIQQLPAPDPLATDWPRFVDTLVAGCAQRHAKGGASPDFVSAIAERLAGVVPELATPVRLVPMHADVHTEHILVDDSLRVTGLLDFGDALIGDPLYDLVTPVTFFVRGRADLLAALIAGFGATPGPELRRRCTAYQLLHQFSDLKRDALLMSPSRQPATLDAALAALWPM